MQSLYWTLAASAVVETGKDQDIRTSTIIFVNFDAPWAQQPGSSSPTQVCSPSPGTAPKYSQHQVSAAKSVASTRSAARSYHTRGTPSTSVQARQQAAVGTVPAAARMLTAQAQQLQVGVVTLQRRLRVSGRTSQGYRRQCFSASRPARRHPLRVRVQGQMSCRRSRRGGPGCSEGSLLAHRSSVPLWQVCRRPVDCPVA